jgi:hypothetical protein
LHDFFELLYRDGNNIVLSKVNNEKCIICGKNAISTFPILPNEEFTFNYNEKHGVELEFGIKKDKNKK